MTTNDGKGPSLVTVDDFRVDPMFPKIERVVADLLVNGNVVTPIDVLVSMGLLTPAHLNDWRFGRVPCLEGVVTANLTRLTRLLRILGHYAHDLNLKPSWTAYMRYGKGPKQRLRLLPCARHHDDATRAGSLRTPITNWARTANLNPVDSALLPMETETKSCGSRARFGHLA